MRIRLIWKAAFFMSHSILRVDGRSGPLSIAFSPPAMLSSLLAQLDGSPVDMPCGGKRRCFKCKVIVSGAAAPAGDQERSLLSEEERAAGVRYACMTEALGDIQVRPVEEKQGNYIQTDGALPSFAAAPWGTRLGAAVDIGTTTLAAYLYDLPSLSLLDAQSRPNPQAGYGADVISRLECSLNGKREELASSIRTGVRQLLGALSRQAGRDLNELDSLVLTGNTAMLYLLCGRDPSSITAAPFEMDCSFGCFLRPDELDLPLGSDCRIYLPRCISAYVGADITTALLAAGFFRDGRVPEGPPRLLIDIGTNGEMALASGGRLLCCSTAAGPALEGAGIRQGMTARDGAVHKVSLTDGRIVCEVLGGGEGTGICGSGLVDAIAVMRRAGVLDETGLIDEESHAFTQWIEEADGQPAFRLPGTRVLLTQKDIRAVQLAKSAICAGMITLIEEAGLPPDQVTSLVIAGGFGARIDVASAEAIGLIPPGFAAKARAVGNGAGAGASMVLLSEAILRDSDRIAGVSRTIELSTHPRFTEAYVEGMFFP